MTTDHRDITLERRDRALNMARFYALRTAPTLFGEWALIREWGRLGRAGRSCETWFADLDAAQAEQAVWERRKRGRGYLPVTAGAFGA